MTEILLTRGLSAKIDTCDFELISKFRWHANRAGRDHFYATSRQDGKTIRMHRLILGLEPGDKREGDHINGDTLDNRRANLRIVTHQQNMTNTRTRRTNRSGQRGVAWDKRTRKWRAEIAVNGRKIWLGRFSDKSQASLVYQQASISHHGEYRNSAVQQ